MKYNIPINLSSIKKNPHGGESKFCYACGPTRTTKTESKDGLEKTYILDSQNQWILITIKPINKDIDNVTLSQETPYQDIFLLSPLPHYLYNHYPTEVKCEVCERKFLHTQLENDSIDDYDYYTHSDAICPFCGAWECCELTFDDLPMQDWVI